MSYYPILINLEGKKVVVVGGGTVAQRKIETILECGGVVHVISRELTPLLHKYHKDKTIRVLDHEFKEDDLAGALLVIAATDDPQLNRRVSQHAREKGMLVNAVDQPADCSFIVPSILRRGDLLIAVSTSGKSPALAKKLRGELEKLFGTEYEPLLDLMGGLRKVILSQGLPQDENKRLFQELANAPILEAIAREDWNEVASIVGSVLQREFSPEDVKNYLKAE